MELFKLILLLSVSSAFVAFAIPTLIKIADKGKFFDMPDDVRKVHTTEIPNLGGIAIYLGFLFACLIFLKATAIEYSNFLLGGTMIIFALGVRDDLVGLNAYKKMVLQLLAATLVVVFGEVRITSFYGLFGVTDLHLWFSLPFSIFVVLVITNAINLIDGIDGLAASIGIIIALGLGIIFYDMNQTGWSRIAFALTGTLVGFLFYNFHPAKIFMGDTGAYLIGFILSILIIQFIELNKFDSDFNPVPYIKSSPAVGIGFMFIPLFDTLRAFMLRIRQGKSPFYADRQHLHHFLLDLGWSHAKISIGMACINVIIMGLCLLLQDIGSFWLITSLGIMGVVLHFGIGAFYKRRSGTNGA
jgi:UDP-N-acetylmuramyl pentapeptide phosphotransferase/UDP-N-acetylglucosamine-1-phosphate transferase